MHAEQAQFDDVNEVAVADRRMQVRAYNYWYSLLDGRDFPAIGDLKPADLEAFALNSVLLDFSKAKDDPALPYIGNAIREHCAVGENVERLSQVPGDSLLAVIADHYPRLIESRAPVGFESAEAQQEGDPLYRGILMPFSSDNQKVDFVYAVINWKTAEEMAAQSEAKTEAAPEYDDLDRPQPLPDAGDDAVVTSFEDGPLHEDDGEPLDPADDSRSEAGSESEPIGEVDEEKEAETETVEPAPVNAEEEEAAESSPTVPFAPVEPDPAPVAQSANPTDEPAQEVVTSEDAMSDEGEPNGVEEEASLVDAAPEPPVEDSASEAVEEPEPQPDAEVEPTAGADDVEPVESASPADVGDGDGVDNETPGDDKDVKVAKGFAALTGKLSKMVGHDPLAGVAVDAEGNVEDGNAKAEDEPAPIALQDVPDTSGEEQDAEENADTVADANAEEEAPEPEPVDTSALDGWLETARASAAQSKDADSRSRAALYRALGEAYDFSLIAADNPDAYAAVLEAAELTVQARAPMTPIVKLVFGRDYDKTRVTEFAAALNHGHRHDVEQGGFEAYVAEAEGGLKGLVAEERKHKRGQDGPSQVETKLDAACKKLRGRDTIDLAHLGANEEFALVLVRRDDNGGHAPIARVVDGKLIERAILKASR